MDLALLSADMIVNIPLCAARISDPSKLFRHLIAQIIGVPRLCSVTQIYRYRLGPSDESSVKELDALHQKAYAITCFTLSITAKVPQAAVNELRGTERKRSLKSFAVMGRPNR